MDITTAVQDRYGAAANEREEALCCPIADYDPAFLKVIPQEVLDRDYGCGDPSRFVREDDVVLDLGSGGGKICFIASQMVGKKGRIIGVDRNRDMLDLAESARTQVAEKTGLDNVEFRVGNIQDLQLNLARLDEWLVKNPVHKREDLFALHAEEQRLRTEEPLVADESIDVVLSNCVLNLVGEEERLQMFEELFRVVKVGGRVAISDIVCDEDVPEHLRNDEELWSGCISGAFREDLFIQAFVDAGFYGVQLVKRDSQPWKVVEGIEFRAVTVIAYKGKEGACKEGNHAVVYPGPWKEVHDDDGHIYKRGEAIAVCSKTYGILTKEPYASQVIGLPPYQEIPAHEQGDFDCSRDVIRHAQETKNGVMPSNYSSAQDCCAEGGCC